MSHVKFDTFPLSVQVDDNIVNLNEQPFSITPDPEFLYFSDTHRSAIENILYGIKCRMGFSLLIGEVGTGKTTVCRHILNTLKDDIETVYLINPSMTGRELISSILDDLEIHHSRNLSKKDMIHLLNRFVISLPDSRPLLIIIDDSQTMPPDTMEDLRLLSNLETNKSKLFQILLAGQPELIDQISCHEMRQLEQRIAVTCHLKNLNLMEVDQFIFKRLHVAGCAEQIQFTPKAVKKIYDASNGIPRLINRICYYSVASAYITDDSIIRPGHVKKALKELRDINFKTCYYPIEKSFVFPQKGSMQFFLVAMVLTAFILIVTYPNLFALFNNQSHADIRPDATVYYKPEKNSLYPDLKNSFKKNNASIFASKRIDSDTKSMVQTPTRFFPKLQPPIASIDTDKPIEPAVCMAASETAASACPIPSPFSVLLGSYQTRQRALNAVVELQKKGIKANIIKVNIATKGSWYRVFSKRFRTKKEVTQFMHTHKKNKMIVLHCQWELIAGIADIPEKLHPNQKVLQENNFDAYIHKTNNNTHALVLGAFIKSKEAEKVAKEVKKLGIKAQIGFR